MNIADAVSFASKIKAARTVANCAALFKEATQPFGFNTFACGVVDLCVANRTVFYMIDWPESWRKFYISSGFVENDPVVNALQTRTEAFTWTDLRNDRKFGQAGREALDKVVAEGWNEGFVVPVRHGADRVGIVSLSGRDPILTAEAKDYISMLAMLLQGHLRYLAAQEGFAVPPGGLTSREIACVQLIAQGMSDLAIANHLKIAPTTAHEFVEKAKRRLNVRSRAELVAIAVGLSIVGS